MKETKGRDYAGTEKRLTQELKQAWKTELIDPATEKRF